MCGIAGAVDAGGAEPAGVERQLDTLDHRGPDSRGSFVSPQCVVGQTRLAVIDLVTGDPPITNEDGTVGVALNGEIYNYRALADGLRARGHHLRTTGDTEVIAHLVGELEPVEVARRLEGMFAFAAWDGRRGRLVLGRDRLGKKPLYYWTGGSRLVFGSEIKAVLADPAVPREMDPDALPAYLTFGYVPTPGTFFAGIRSVPPGHVLVVEPGAEPRLECYWSPPLPAATAPPMAFAEAVHQARGLLTAAVERRMVADVPLGAFLSGGLDSSAVVAIMAGLSSQPVRTFTIGFTDGSFDERPYARMVAERFGTEHVEFVVTPDAIELVERLVWHHDQPFADSSAIPTYLLSELTRRHVTVALAGDGGDEVFAGYERFVAAGALQRVQWVPGSVRTAVTGVAARIPGGDTRRVVGRAKRFLATADRTPLEAVRALLAPIDDGWRDALLGAPAPPSATDAWRTAWAASEGSDLLTRLLDLNVRTYLLDDLLPKVDRASMAHGLEVRTPLLDQKLMEWVAGLPRTALLRGFETKRVLRAAMATELPPEILRRRKKGFGVPVDRWFRTDLSSYLESMLGSPAARVRAHLEPDAVDRLLSEHRTGTANHGPALFALLTLEIFLRRESW